MANKLTVVSISHPMRVPVCASFVPTLQALVRLNLSLGNEPLARAHLSRLKQVNPSHPLVKRLEGGATPRGPDAGSPRAEER